MKKALFVSLIFLMIFPICLVNAGVNPPKTIDYGDIVSIDHIVYTDETLEIIIEVQYDIIINVSSTIDWHSGLVGLTESSERTWLLNTPVEACVHWVFIRQIHEWLPVQPDPPEPFLDSIINWVLSFASENLIGIIISGLLIIYILSKVLLQ